MAEEEEKEDEEEEEKVVEGEEGPMPNAYYEFPCLTSPVDLYRPAPR